MCQQNKSKWIRYTNVKNENIKALGKNCIIILKPLSGEGLLNDNIKPRIHKRKYRLNSTT